MSDIFIAAGIPADTADLAKQLTWTEATAAWRGSSDVYAWVATRVDNPALWAPATDAQSGVRVIIGGRIGLEESEWKRAESLPYEGGLAARLVLDRWLGGGASSIERLNGAALVVVADERRRLLHIWTDRMGFYPAFASSGPGLLLCSHPDVAAAALERAGRPCDFDAVTMAEFLRTGTSTQPHTYWKGIRHLDAGTYYCFDVGPAPKLRESRQYWRPGYFDRPYIEDRREVVTRLADALTKAVRRRTLPRLGPAAVLLSAGADSRAALFGACEPAKVSCFTVFDEPNAELHSARRLAEAAGAPHHGYQRTKEYYIERAPHAVRISGGMWSVDSAHFGGLTPELRSKGSGVVLTGCYADYLLKGLGYNRGHKKLLGRPIPLYSLEPYAHQWYQPFYQIAGDWTDLVEHRLEDRFSAALEQGPRQQSMAEHLRLSPIIREADASGRLLLRRECAHDFILSDNDVLELVGCIAPAEKLSGIAFGMAVDRITGARARHVRNNNYGSKIGASELGRVSSFVLASVGRKLRGQGSGQPSDRDPQSVATVGSWPNFSRVISLSGQLKDWWGSRPGGPRDFLNEMIGAPGNSLSLDDWARHAPMLFMRYYTASLWLSQHPEALGRLSKDRTGT